MSSVVYAVDSVTLKIKIIKQLRRAVQQGQVRLVFLACDADPMLTDPIRRMCEETGVLVSDVPTMAELGKACGISVKASAAGLLLS